MNISPIVTLCILLYTAAIAAITLLQARNKSWIMTAIRLGETFVAALLAIPLAKSLSGTMTDLAMPLVDNLVPDDWQGFLTAVPALEEGVRVFCGMLIAVLLYLPIFAVIRLLLGIAGMICEREIPVLAREEDKKLAISLPVAGAHALLMAIVTLIPLCSFIMMGSHLIGTIEKSPALESAIASSENAAHTLDTVERTAGNLEKNPCVVAVHYTLGKPVYTLLTTDRLNKTATHGENVRMNMERELSGLIHTAGSVIEAKNAFASENFSEKDKKQLFEAADDLFASKWVGYVATDSLVALSKSWKEGDTFLGIARPTMAEVIDPTFVCLLEVLSTETPETLSEDIHVILDVLSDLRLRGFLDSDTIFYDDLIRSLGQDGFLSTLLTKLDQNERMHLLVDELKTMNVRLVGSMLGIEHLQSGQYDALMGDVATSLNDVLQKPAEERNEIIKQTINQNFDTHGFHVPEDVALEVSDKIINELGADGEITKDELTAFLSSYASKSDESDSPDEENPNGNGSMGDNVQEETENVTLPDDLPNGWQDNLPESLPDGLLEDILGGLTGEPQTP